MIYVFYYCALGNETTAINVNDNFVLDIKCTPKFFWSPFTNPLPIMKTSPLVALLLTVLVAEVTSYRRLKNLCADFYQTCPTPGLPGVHDNVHPLSAQCDRPDQKSDSLLDISLANCPFLLRKCPSLRQKISRGRKICSQIMCVDSFGGLGGTKTLCEVGI